MAELYDDRNLDTIVARTRNALGKMDIVLNEHGKPADFTPRFDERTGEHPRLQTVEQILRPLMIMEMRDA